MRKYLLLLVVLTALIGCASGQGDAQPSPTDEPSGVAEATDAATPTTEPTSAPTEAADPTDDPTDAPSEEEQPTEAVVPEDSLMAMTASGQLEVSEVVSINDLGATMGPILQIRITNPTTGEVTTTIPCGLVLMPLDEGGDEGDPPATAEGEEDKGDQRMMVIQRTEVTVPAGGEATATPYVICIDPDKDAPAPGATYNVGTLTNGDLLKLSECLCENEMPGALGMDNMDAVMGLQFAVWSIADPDLEMDFSALENIPGMEELAGLEGMFEDMFGGSMEVMNQWLGDCGFEVPES